MDPRQVRGEELQKRLRLLAPQQVVEGGTGRRFLDGETMTFRSVPGIVSSTVELTPVFS